MCIDIDGERFAFSVPEVARRLGVSDTHCWRMVNEGKLRSVRLGERVLVPAQVLRELLAGEQVA